MCSFNLSNVNFEQINTIMYDIHNKSLRLDELHITIFKDNLDIFDMTVFDIVNNSSAQGNFPWNFEWQISKDRSYKYKSGEKDKIKNYRPISLLPVFSNILYK